MQNEFTNVAVLLFDAKGSARRQARGALNSLGFQSVADTNDLSAIPELLNQTQFGLLFCGIDGAEDGVADLVRRIRRGECGRDPFVPIILTAWTPPRELVTTALQAGIDDLLIWPFSIQQLKDRIHGLIRSRKKFVVSENYMGPDRRMKGVTVEDFDTIEVPNVLKATVEDNPNLMPTDDAVSNTMAKLQTERIRSEARRIETAAESIVASASKGQGSRAVDQANDLSGLTARFRESIEGSRFAHLAQLTGAVDRVANNISANDNAITERDLALLGKTTQALAVAAHMDESVADAALDISAEIRKIGA